MGDMQPTSSNDIFSALLSFFFQTPFGLALLAVVGLRGWLYYRDVKAGFYRRIVKGKRRKPRPGPLYRELLPYAVGATFVGLWAASAVLSGSSDVIMSIICWGLPLAAVLWGMIWVDHRTERHRFDRIVKTNNALYELKTMSPDDFESFVAELFRRKGYHARVVGEIGDHGVDIDVRNLQGQRAIVQCKRYADGWVGESTIRDLYGAFMHDGQATSAFLVTTSFFSAPAKAWAKGKPIKLIDGPALVRAWEDLNA
jgi:hypothetical protein